MRKIDYLYILALTMGMILTIITLTQPLSLFSAAAVVFCLVAINTNITILIIGNIFFKDYDKEENK